MIYLRYRWMILLFIVSLKLAVYGQPFNCASDSACQAMLFPTCGKTTAGVCDKPTSDSDCDYLGAGSGYMVTIGSLNVCTKVCSNDNDCANLPTAKICLSSGTSLICSECETTDDCGEMAFQYHNCNSGFCQAPSTGGSNKCSFSQYCTDPADGGCYYDGARCWEECDSNDPCDEASCFYAGGTTGTGTGYCSNNTNFPPSIICSSDSDCTTTALPYCEGTTCRPCDTSGNSGCTSVTASKCVTSLLAYSCVACSTNTDCSHLSSTPYCEGGTCVQCLTSGNTGCTTVTAAACVASSATANICAACAVNSDCSHLTSTPYCNQGTCGKCQTSNNTACTSINEPKCSPSSSTSYQCTTCSEDSDCTRFSSTPVCGTSGACVLCLTSNNSGCTNITAPKCISSGSSYSCTTCSANSDCSQFSSTPYCGSQGACVQCLTSNNTGCTNITAPKCNSSSNTCVACAVNSDCSQFLSTPYCGSGGSCVQCLTSNNSGCTAPTPYCNGGTCGACSTNGNSGCTMITAPKCISPSYTCAACTLDSDCTQFPLAPYCGEAGSCVQCLTSNNSGCTTITAPKCSSSSNTCAACTLDSDCTQFPSTPYCGSGGSCVQCLTSNNSGCTTITAPKCISPSNTCIACTLDSDCTQFSLTPYCGSGGICVQCLTSNNSGCTTITAPRCISPSNTCAACTLDSDCIQFSSTPFCGEAGTCVQCLTSNNSGCTTITAPKCSSPSNTCAACTLDSDCTQFSLNTYCGSGGTCVLCLTSNNSGCTAPTPYCNGETCGACSTNGNIGCTMITAPKCISPSYTCAACTLDSDCTQFPLAPFCGEAGTCVQCLTSNNSGCTTITAPKCSSSSNTCAACTLDSDCTQFPSTPYCGSGGSCVQCLTSNNSGCTSITAPKCSSSSNTCIACTLDSDCTQFPSTPYCGSGGSCAQCLTSNNSGCTTITAPKCSSSSNTCAACTLDSDCTQFSSTPYCGSGGSCAQCLTSNNSGCTTITAPRCISPSNTCAACTLDSDCTQFSSTPYCGEAGTCVQCLTSNNSGCTIITAPKCISPSNTCAACTLDSDCTQFSLTPYCGSGGSCVQCLTSNNSGCTTITAPKCISPSNTCAACTLDSDCTQFSLTPYCGSGGSCVQCLTSNNSGCTTITAPKCISPSNKCAACTLDSDCTQFSSTPYCEEGTCVFCKTSDNSGCASLNPVCVSNSTSNLCAASSCPSNNPPTGGSLSVSPTTGGTPLSTNFTATLSGWSSQNGGTLTYALEYIKASPLSSDPIQISDFSPNTHFFFYLPYTSVATIQATIQNVQGCVTNVTATTTLSISSPDGADLLQSAINLLSNITLANASDSDINVIIDQINIANQLLLCNNDLNSAECNATQTTSLDQSTYDLQTELRQSIINSTVASMNTQNIPQMMSILDALTDQPYLNSNSTLNLTLAAVTQAIQVLNSSSFNDTNLPSDIQDISDTISNGFDQITTLDCGLYNNFSVQALNQSYDLLQQLSNTFVQKSSNSMSNPQLDVNTNAFLMQMGVYNTSQLNNLQINVSSSAPELQLSSLENEASLPPTIALTYIYLKKDPLSCNSSPATNFTLEFENAQTLQEVYPNVSVLITYPQNIFGKVACPNQCNSGDDPEGNNNCFCKNISIFDVKNQLSMLYEQSNLHLLTLANISKIFTSSAIFLQWSFWVVVATIIWFVVTLIAVKTCNKDYCLAKKVRKSTHKNASRRWLEKFCIYFAVIHPLFGIYFYKGIYATSKSFRALIYFVRIMTLLGTSAIFMNNPQNGDNNSVTFEGELFSLDIYLILAPLIIVLPLNFAIQKALSVPKPKKTEAPAPSSNAQIKGQNQTPPQDQKKLPGAGPQISKCRRIVSYIGATLAIILAIAGVIVALTISLQIDSAQQLSWAAKFTKSILQDMFISPLLTLVLNFIALRCSRRAQKIKPVAKFVTAETVMELSSGFKKRVAQVNITTKQPTTRLSEPPEGQFDSSTTSVTINQNKRVSYRPRIQFPGPNSTTTRNISTNPNLISDLNESRNQLNESSFQNLSSQGENNIQRRTLIPKRIDLEGLSLQRRTTKALNEPQQIVSRKSSRETDAVSQQDSRSIDLIQPSPQRRTTQARNEPPKIISRKARRETELVSQQDSIDKSDNSRRQTQVLFRIKLS